MEKLSGITLIKVKPSKSGTKREHVPLESLRRSRVTAMTHHEEILDKTQLRGVYNWLLLKNKVLENRDREAILDQRNIATESRVREQEMPLLVWKLMV